MQIDALSIITTAVVGVVASAITAYITVRINSKQEQKRFEREIAQKMAEFKNPPDSRTRIMAVQFAEGFLIVERTADLDKQKVFLPSGCRVTLGRDKYNHIIINSPLVSQTHVAFSSTDSKFWVEPLGAENSVLLNGNEINVSSKLKPGDKISIAGLESVSITFQTLEH